MNPKRTTVPVEPVTLAEAKLHLRIDDDDASQDAMIAATISAAREACEERINGTIPVTSWRLTLDAFPDAILLPHPPVASVESVKFIDANGVEQTLSPLDYMLDSASSPGYVVPAYGKTWPTTQDRINAVTVDYTAGSSVPPPSLKAWILASIMEIYRGEVRTTQRSLIDRLLDPFMCYR